MQNSTIQVKKGICKDCPVGSEEKPLIAKRCSTHYWNYRASLKPVKIKDIGKPIPKVSKKRLVENAKYTVKRLEFLGKKENQICPINKTQTTDVHHLRGRIGFADEWARVNNIPLLLDTRFWIALSREAHQYVETHPQWAKENGYSLNRL